MLKTRCNHLCSIKSIKTTSQFAQHISRPKAHFSPKDAVTPNYT